MTIIPTSGGHPGGANHIHEELPFFGANNTLEPLNSTTAGAPDFSSASDSLSVWIAVCASGPLRAVCTFDSTVGAAGVPSVIFFFF